MNRDRLDDEKWTLAFDDPAYPRQLRETSSPPQLLYGMGDPGLMRAGLAIIGSRRASPYGLTCAARFGAAAAAAGVVVTSGGATGCDAEAHRATLAVGGATVCVLGCGADVDYPRRERDTLASLRRTGCVVSELPFGHPPRRWAFPRRNRIIAGLSRAVLVVEAGLPSGTFSTADHALDEGRDVLAVPGSIFATGSAGTNRLIAQGASPITGEEDLLAALCAAGLTLRRLADRDPPRQSSPIDSIARALVSEPMGPNRLAQVTGSTPREAMLALGRLESDGAVVRLPDGTYTPSRALLERLGEEGGLS